MKAFLCSACLVCILIASAVYGADDWTEKFPVSNPSGRLHHAMAYIGGDQGLLFGGSVSGDRDDETWVYDLSANTWTNKSPSTKPSARYNHRLSHIGGDQVLLFGGDVDDNPTDETWVYDLSANTWTNKNPSTKPSPKQNHAMAYIGGDQVLLFGGAGDDDTWVYDLSDNTWTQKFHASKPSARDYHAMAYIGGDQVLLFGGNQYSGPLGDDTWVYDLSANTWTNKSPSTKPSARDGHDMAYIGGDQVLLFGGHDGSTAKDDTWVYDLSDNTWTQDTNSTQPPARQVHSLCETSMDGSSYLVLFGGSGYKDDTWTFGGGDYSLPVELRFLKATAGDGQVTLRWITESEVDNLGFHIYRSLKKEGIYERLTSEVIEGAGTTTSSREYAFTDIRLTNGVIYWYKLEDVAFDGTRTMHGPIAVTPQAEAEVAVSLPEGYGLSPCYPNPFNPSTTIRYQLPEPGDVRLAIYDVLGQEVWVLVSEMQPAGWYRVRWDGRDGAGRQVSSGVYLCRLEVEGEFLRTRKMVLVR